MAAGGLESLQILADLGLLHDALSDVNKPKGITLGRKALFDDVFQKACTAHHDGDFCDNDLFTISRIIPQSLSLCEKVPASIATAASTSSEEPRRSDAGSCSTTPSNQGPDLCANASQDCVENSYDSCIWPPPSEGRQGNLFNRRQSLYILSLYTESKQKFLSPVYKKKLLWKDITDNLNEHFNTAFTKEQVEGKWKTLLSAFKRHKSDQSKT